MKVFFFLVLFAEFTQYMPWTCGVNGQVRESLNLPSSFQSFDIIHPAETMNPLMRDQLGARLSWHIHDT